MRLPVTTDLKTRLSNTTKDARLINALTEAKADGQNARKRPGMINTQYDYAGHQGFIGLNGLVYLVYDDKFELGGLLWLPWWSYSVGDVVSHDGELWESTGATVGTEPPGTGWIAYVPSVPGWDIVGSSLPKDLSYYLANALATSSGINLLTGENQKSYQSTDGATWSAGTTWTGTGYNFGVSGGWSDGTTMWHCVCFSSTLYVDKTTYSAFTGLGSSAIGGGLLSDYAEPELYKIGSTLYARVSNTGSVARFVSSADGAISWSTITSDLPFADFSKIVIMGSTAYSIPAGGGGGKKVYSSTDFSTWTLVTSDWGLGTETIRSVAKQNYGSKIVVLLSSDDVATTTDGATWTKSTFTTHTIPPAFTPKCLCQYAGDWYALGQNSWAKLPASRVP